MPATPTEDFCRCGHVASQHIDGEGSCAGCKRERRTIWSALEHCQHFRWAETWQRAPGAA